MPVLEEGAVWLFNHDDYIDPEDFREEIECDHGYTLEELSDEDKWEWLSRQEEYYYEDEKANIQNVIGDKRIIAFGKAGLWNGDFEGGFIAQDLQDAIHKIRGNTYGYVGFYALNEELHMTFAHHDGMHDLVLRAITSAGEDYIDNMEYELAEQDIEKDVFRTPEYSEAINMLHAS